MKAKLANATALGPLLQYHLATGAHILPNSVKASESLPTLLKGHNLSVKKVRAHYSGGGQWARMCRAAAKGSSGQSARGLLRDGSVCVCGRGSNALL